MKQLFTICVLLLTIVSCSSVKQVANDVYEAKCHSVVGNCQEIMEKTCPNGYQVTNKDWSYGLGGSSDVMNFTCKKEGV